MRSVIYTQERSKVGAAKGRRGEKGKVVSLKSRGPGPWSCQVSDCCRLKPLPKEAEINKLAGPSKLWPDPSRGTSPPWRTSNPRPNWVRSSVLPGPSMGLEHAWNHIASTLLGGQARTCIREPQNKSGGRKFALGLLALVGLGGRSRVLDWPCQTRAVLSLWQGPAIAGLSCAPETTKSVGQMHRRPSVQLQNCTKRCGTAIEPLTEDRLRTMEHVAF